MLHIAWSTADGHSGTAGLAPGSKLVLARRMELPERQQMVVEEISGSLYVLVRLPYVSDPALVLTSTDSEPVLYRRQRANGAIIEVTAPGGVAVTPEPGQRITLTASGTEVSFRVPELDFTMETRFASPPPADTGSGTVQLGLSTLERDDSWLVAALAVALSPEHGVVPHGELKAAFAAWRGIAEPSVGSFDRNVLRPAVEARAPELPGTRLNKIAFLVERCRRTAEFPPPVLDEVRRRLRSLPPPGR